MWLMKQATALGTEGGAFHVTGGSDAMRGLSRLRCTYSLQSNQPPSTCKQQSR